IFVVFPTVILATKVRIVSFRRTAQPAMAVSADIEEGMDLAILVAHQERLAEQIQCQEIARTRQITCGADDVPGREEQTIHLPLVLSGIVIVNWCQKMLQSIFVY